MSLPRIALIGECMIELQQHADGSLHQSFGGDTLNTAVYLSRLLGERAKVDYVTALGDDSFSDAMCRAWADEGIGLGKVQRMPGRLPGLYCIQTDASGERRFLYWRNEAAVRDCFMTPAAEPILAALASYDVLYFSGITLAVLGEQGRARLLEALGRARLRGVRVAFDNNYRPRLWASVEQAREAYQACLPHVDLALLTEDDEQALYGYADSEELLAAYRDRGIGEIVVKRGAQSCLIEAGGERFEVAPLKVEQVVDTTAAGDSFSAAYLAARLMGERPQQAAEAGHRLAAVVIQHPGALIAKSVMPV
ncbi:MULTISPECIES: sugar kinase [Pseudomonas]|uniref:2-dehydro-3-deoxygluconokinase n=4 Tax=Pseudomonas syringae group genomosp. 3 TaxID=251701 RepID=Q881V0_PSESM|nr:MULTISPECIES: sugar kinase [Pseudomonas]AAO56282.1 2-dehydro-3-deoxygluconokinase [Pseudomonas syringae pv. tomato str. DC3000]KKI26321.1 ketodeoxygluconokinase [Pseudomonas syringae pv. persicae]KPB89365.1 2-dehydro-3-deoxygluconokinase [Pseudomonas syringae pv. maculicola]KPB90949.1 2-dehydro-3-deoxygluconokinase [Pseudomonas syringae pv. maculicola str. M6]KPC16820.1 2-dehydro-3-deoxygluconokinase [Pseudomonas syringae pv. maculicola]